MKKYSFILIYTIFIASLFSLFSVTIEERLLQKKEQRIMTYKYQARAGDRIQKENILNNILEEFDSANYSEKDETLVEVVIFLSEEGSIRQEYEENRLMNNFPEVRRKACIVLGKLGGDRVRGALIDVLVNDPSPMVKSEACNALAQVKDNGSGEVLRAIVYAYRSTYKPDPNFIFAIINAVKVIAKGNMSAYGDAIMILSEIQMGQYTRKVREAAFDAIQSLATNQ